MLKDARVDKISAFVKNFNRAASFYKNKLGLKPIWESLEGRNVGFRVGNNLLILQEGHVDSVRNGFTVNFTVRGIQRLRGRLLESGVSCSELQDCVDFKWVTFKDPDGNCLGLMEPSAAYIPKLAKYLDQKVVVK